MVCDKKDTAKRQSRKDGDPRQCKTEHFIWQCRMGDGWVDCDEDVQDALSQAEIDGVTNVTLGTGLQQYEYDLEVLRRIHVETQKMRLLRRRTPALPPLLEVPPPSDTSSASPTSPTSSHISSFRSGSSKASKGRNPRFEIDIEQEDHGIWRGSTPKEREVLLHEMELADVVLAKPENWSEFKYRETLELPPGRYLGEAMNGVAQGKGFLTLDDGSYHVGSFSVGKVTGKGARFDLSNKRVVIGTWKRGQAHGACFEYSTKFTKLSMFKDGEPQGPGILSGHPVWFGLLDGLPRPWRGGLDPMLVKNLSRSVQIAKAEVCIVLYGSLSKLKLVQQLAKHLQEAMIWLQFILPSTRDLEVPKELKQVLEIVTPPQIQKPSEPLYEIKFNPLSGIGMYARRRIAARQCILMEAPLFIATSFNHAKRKAEALKGKKAEHFWALHDNFTPECQEKKVGGVILTNAIPCWPHSNTHGGVHGTLSRANHACRPNARVFWNASSKQSVLLATRNILPGEEIFISYIRGERWPREQRRQYLKNSFGFDCICTLCCLDPNKREVDDEQQIVMKRLQSMIPFLKQQPRLALAASTHLIRLLLQETPLGEFSGLAHTLARISLNAYEFASKGCGPEEASPWLKIYARCMLVAEGPDSEESRRALKLRQCFLNNETLPGCGSAGVLCSSDLTHLLLHNSPPQKMTGPFHPSLYGVRALISPR